MLSEILSHNIEKRYYHDSITYRFAIGFNGTLKKTLNTQYTIFNTQVFIHVIYS